ncbi:uroporphyrinogen-III methyltransferase [Cutibacterium acnes JCM 18918]|nr:uroporphyrinogen-III methyltransferase [Cutibacterium acnes JCM 18918]
MLTVAGFEAVRQADVILYDRLAPTAVMDENPQAERIPVGKVPRGPYVPQERTNELLIEHAKAGRKVVRLKGGDSFVFWSRWRGVAGLRCCWRSGAHHPRRHFMRSRSRAHGGSADTSSYGAGIYRRFGSRRPWRYSVRIGLGPDRQDRHYPGDSHGSGPHWRHRYPPHGRRVGRDTPVAIIADASLPTQRSLTTTLEKAAEDMAEAEINPPAITVVGDVAGLDLDGTQAHVPSDH